MSEFRVRYNTDAMSFDSFVAQAERSLPNHSSLGARLRSRAEKGLTLANHSLRSWEAAADCFLKSAVR